MLIVLQRHAHADGSGYQQAKDRREASHTMQSHKEESPSPLHTVRSVFQTDPALNPNSMRSWFQVKTAVTAATQTAFFSLKAPASHIT